MSVVVAYAETDESEFALTHGVREARQRELELHVLATSTEAAESARRRLQVEAVEVPIWEIHSSPHQPYQSQAVIDLVAELDAEMIVVGTRRRSPVGKLFLGSMAQDILLGAEVPVLLVKH